ncbi:MAG: amidohydrolase [Bacteroidales bacterium]|jgi:predicted amidohydrolase
MTNHLKIVLLQYDIIWQDISANLEKVEKLLAGMKESPDLIILPEMFATGFTMEPWLFDNHSGSVVHDWMTRMAKEYGVAVTGSNPVQESNDYYNRLHFISPEDNHIYDKKHLFAMGDETKHYKAGNKQKTIGFRGWNIMPLICYDLRFPCWSRNLKEKYDLLVYVANWPAVRNEVWETLLKARAIENQCYVAGVNRIGKDGRGIKYMGNSQVISPKGEVITKSGNREGIIFAQIDLDLLRRFRTAFPVLDDADDFIIK